MWKEHLTSTIPINYKHPFNESTIQSVRYEIHSFKHQNQLKSDINSLKQGNPYKYYVKLKVN